MSGIIRNAPRRRYTSIPNKIIEDASLTWEARGMLIYLLSKPDNWCMQVKDLINKSPDGKEKTTRILCELKTFGYIQSRRFNNKAGRIQWETLVFDSPQAVPEPAPKSDSPCTGKPCMVEPSTDNPAIHILDNPKGLSNIKLNEADARNAPAAASSSSSPVATQTFTQPPAPDAYSQTDTRSFDAQREAPGLHANSSAGIDTELPKQAKTEFEALVNEIVITIGEMPRWQIGTTSSSYRHKILKLARQFESEGFGAADFETYRANLPKFLNRAVETLTPPSLDLLARQFGRVVQWKPAPPKTIGVQFSDRIDEQARRRAAIRASIHADAVAGGLIPQGATWQN